MESLKEHFPRGVDAIIEGYAPYWMGVGQATFVKTLQRIHPDHVRDIWADRREALNNQFGLIVSVVAELIDYYCDVMESDCGHSYAYIPVLFDLASYSDTKASSRSSRIHNASGRPGCYIPHTVPLISDMKLQRHKVYGGGMYSQLRIDRSVDNKRRVGNPQFLYT